MNRMKYLLLIILFIISFSAGMNCFAQSFVIFQEDFESDDYYVGDEQILWPSPYIGGSFGIISGAIDQFLISDTQAIGTKSFSLERRNNAGYIYFYPSHTIGKVGLLEGQTLIVEVDVYIPSGSQPYLTMFNGAGATSAAQKPCAVLSISNKWYCPNYDENNTLTYVVGPSIQTEKWNHIKMEVYGDKTYSVWITPFGDAEVKIADKAGVYKTTSYDLRPAAIAQAPENSLVYYDNIKYTHLDTYSQGYPTIYKTPNPITIDGSIDMNTEWAGATLVASRPAGGIGNYRDHILVADPMNPTTYVNTYVTFDSENFYIATEMNNALWGVVSGGDWAWYGNSYLQAIFFIDDKGDTGLPNDTNDISYIFRASAAATSPIGGSEVYDVMYSRYGSRSQWGATWEGDPYTKILPAGTEISYSVNTVTKIIQIEMKIPFSAMPELADVSRGAQVTLSFVVKDDTGRAMTSITGEEWPYVSYYGDPQSYRNVNPNVGVTFAQCGTMEGDFVPDCMIGTEDLVEFFQHWLDCNHPDCL